MRQRTVVDLEQQWDHLERALLNDFPKIDGKSRDHVEILHFELESRDLITQLVQGGTVDWCVQTGSNLHEALSARR